MINEDLLVNSKTDILEFKRKHNLLVGKGVIKTTVSNIKQLTNVDIENLSCGDVVLKEDASGKHAYLVSFKSATGLCLTYCDASCVETQSYDKVEDNWQYNSEDKWEMTNPIYIHPILVVQPTPNPSEYYSFSLFIFDNNPVPYNDFSKLVSALYSIFDKLPSGTTARFPCSGSILNSDGKYQINSTLEVNAKTLSNIQVIGVQADGLATNLTRRDFNGIQNARIFDGVNRIN